MSKSHESAREAKKKPAKTMKEKKAARLEKKEARITLSLSRNPGAG
jgi:hypothetical protein